MMVLRRRYETLEIARVLNMYVLNLMFSNSCKGQRETLKLKWTNLTDEERIPFEKKTRDHLAKQELMKECITDAL
jgi:hypothetical protein